MEISVVIATCNRKQRLLQLLGNLLQSNYPLKEVIIVDSGEDRLTPDELKNFAALQIIYLNSEKSVCAQRNKGIAIAKSGWIFICDDDIEVPKDYVEKIVEHIAVHPEVIAVSGLVLQLENNKWTAWYPVSKTRQLTWKYIFKLSVWGEITCNENFFTKKILRYYKKKGNHISKAGWPIITDIKGEYFATPVYGLGASVIKKSMLLHFPYDENLDSNGIGDNYGLAINFPQNGIHVLNNAFVYHHRDPANRLQLSTQYYRRALALDYFMRTNKNITYTKKIWLLWSLFGNLLLFVASGNWEMIKISFKTIFMIAFNRNSIR